MLRTGKNEIPGDVFARQNFFVKYYIGSRKHVLRNLVVRVLLVYLAMQENVRTCSVKPTKETTF